MSFRDLRNFSEAMRDLGFPLQISLESFRTPNWELVEACLRWLAARVEPDSVLAGGKDSMEQRVAMVLHAIELFHSRANLKLNGKKLYGADGWAVREMLKVAAMLRAALHSNTDDGLENLSPLVYDISQRVGEIRQARALATDITAQGALLHDLLVKEPDNREIRERALSRPLDLRALETALSRAVTSAGERVARAGEQIDSVAASESALDAKLERRRADLQRAEKRLHTVQKIKPAYQGELTSLETQIEQLWEQYALRYRCVEALKHQLSLLETAQSEAAEEQQAAIMQLIHKYESEELLGKLDHSDELDSSDDSREVSRRRQREVTRPATRLRIKTAGASGSESRPGFLAGRDSPDDIRDEDDSRSDSDFSDTELYAGSAGDGRAARWSRRPTTRTLGAALAQYEQPQGGGRVLNKEMADDDDAQSLPSSAESELRMNSIRVGSDNEF